MIHEASLACFLIRGGREALEEDAVRKTTPSCCSLERISRLFQVFRQLSRSEQCEGLAFASHTDGKTGLSWDRTGTRAKGPKKSPVPV